jgi:hypothetical protein
MAKARKKPTRKPREAKTLVRGPDGSLYMISHRDLTLFKVQKEKSKKLDQLLKSAKKYPVPVKLPAALARRIRRGFCVWAGADS